ncbi:hypothetical protein [Halorussus amylolyticus]|uniref:hypothetical protein n=1 Tax=Halorussus amylolyticus TaxID=1126242 RepID=UPI00104B26DD|nr:hypothetical protein [Halorussus amylolyticus]
MSRWLRIGGWALLAVVVLWVVLELVSILLGIVSWVVSAVVSLLLLAGLLYLAYLAVSKFVGGNGGSGRSRSRERERIYE